MSKLVFVIDLFLVHSLLASVMAVSISTSLLKRYGVYAEPPERLPTWLVNIDLSCGYN